MSKRIVRLLIVLALGAMLWAGCGQKPVVRSPLEKAPPEQVMLAREAAARGDVDAAAREYVDYIETHPGSAEANLARLELAVLRADMGDCAAAIPLLEEAEKTSDEAIELRARLNRGRCYAELGDADGALEIIEPLTEHRFSPEEQALLWDTAVSSAERATDAALALRVLDGMFTYGGPEPDPVRADTALQSLLYQRLSTEDAAALLSTLHAQGRVQVALARRLLPEALQAQDAALVAQCSEILRSSAMQSDPEVQALLASAQELVGGNPHRLGALLPLTGRGREVGKQLLQGMQLAELLEGGPQLIVEDTAGDPSRAAQAVDSLVRDQGVVAILGPVGTRTTAAAIEELGRTQVPMLTFSSSEDASNSGEEVFRFPHSPRDELRALVRASQRKGFSRFVILHPDHGYGRALSRIFDEEVGAAGGSLCPPVAYPPGTKSFGEYVKQVLKDGCDVVLMADTAEQVALIAPTFAAEGAWSSATDVLPSAATERVHFLISSPSWSPTLSSRAGRYLQGALVTQPYYGASEDPLNIEFREQYSARYGRPPEMFAAYGYDAYRVVSAVLRQGYQERKALAEALSAGLGVSSVTSVGSMSTSREPASAPRVYELVEDLLQPAR